MIRTTLMLAAALAGTGCYTMRTLTVDDLGSGKTARVWVTRPDQSVVMLEDAQMFRGKLAGFASGQYLELPTDDVRQIQIRKLATARTVTLIAAGATVATVAAVLLAGNSDAFDNCIGNDDCEDALRVAY